MKLTCDNWQCDLKPSKIEIKHNGNDEGAYFLLRRPFCERCGSNGKNTEACTWHYRFHPLLSRVYAVGIYFEEGNSPIKGDILSSHIWWLKFKSEEYARPIGTSMALAIKGLYTDLMEYDVLVPIPPFSGSTPKRYDHAEEIAKVLSNALGKPYKQLLRKTRHEKMVEKPTMDDRWEASKNLFELETESQTKGLKVLLIDDICTSGSTLSGSAGVLTERGGATKVAAFVAGRRFDTNYPVS
jgi:predicted amidophosphoribosyltransferase